MKGMKRFCASALLVAISASVSAQGGQLSENEKAMVSWIDAHQGEAIALLEETVNIGSGTMNHAGVRAVGDVMTRELDSLGLETRWIDMPEGNEPRGTPLRDKKRER